MNYITNAIDIIARWFVLSSANPQEVSLTVKGALVGAVPFIIAVAGIAHINVGQDTLNAIVDGLATFVQATLTAVSVAIMLYGMLRKVWLTIQGQNQVNAGRAL